MTAPQQGAAPGAHTSAIRERIEAMLRTTGPIRARLAYGVLREYGYTDNQIEAAKRWTVRVEGRARGAVWHLIPNWREPEAASRARKREALDRGRKLAGGKSVESVAYQPRPKPRPFAPPLRKPRQCAVCRVPIGQRAPGEPDVCLKDSCIDAARVAAERLEAA